MKILASTVNLVLGAGSDSDLNQNERSYPYKMLLNLA